MKPKSVIALIDAITNTNPVPFMVIGTDGHGNPISEIVDDKPPMFALQGTLETKEGEFLGVVLKYLEPK